MPIFPLKTQGEVSAYFTVFTWSYLNVHTTKTENADQLYQRHLGSKESVFKVLQTQFRVRLATHSPNVFLKLPLGVEDRDSPFPPLGHQDITISGAGWKRSAADVVLSSAGWVGVTFGGEGEVTLRAHTPHGRGIHIRHPSLFEGAVNQRGKRERGGNRRAFLGNAKKRK